MLKDNIQRVVVYIPSSKHKKLKLLLAARGNTVSEWFRKMVDKEIEGK